MEGPNWPLASSRDWYSQRRRIQTEEKGKVVAVVRGTELIQCFFALAILRQDDLTSLYSRAVYLDLYYSYVLLMTCIQ